MNTEWHAQMMLIIMEWTLVAVFLISVTLAVVAGLVVFWRWLK